MFIDRAGHFGASALDGSYLNDLSVVHRFLLRKKADISCQFSECVDIKQKYTSARAIRSIFVVTIFALIMTFVIVRLKFCSDLPVTTKYLLLALGSFMLFCWYMHAHTDSHRKWVEFVIKYNTIQNTSEKSEDVLRAFDRFDNEALTASRQKVNIVLTVLTAAVLNRIILA